MDNILILDFFCTVTCSHFFNFIEDLPAFKQKYGYLLDRWNIKKPRELRKQFINRVEGRTDTLDESAFKNLVFCGQDRINLLAKFFKYLQDNKIKIIICSSGYWQDIRIALKIADLYKYIYQIVATSSSARNQLFIVEDMEKQFTKLKSPKAIPTYPDLADYINSLLADSNYKKIVYVDDRPDTDFEVAQYYRNFEQPPVQYTYIGNNNLLPPENTTGIGIEIIQQVLKEFGLNPLDMQQGGSNNYYRKYLKYKQKYSNLLAN